MNDPFFFNWQKKIIRRRLFGYAIIFLFLGLFVGVGLGMVWRMAQVEPERDKQIVSLKEKIEHYRNHWTPIKEKEVKASGKRKGPGPPRTD